MSSEITVARSQQYSDSVQHLSQQKGSRLRSAVRNESQKGKSAFYDRLGESVAQQIPSRHADTVLTDTPHSRRRVTLKDFAVADMIDDQDKARMAWDPQGLYAQSQGMSIGRAYDDEIILRAVGLAYGGEEGATSVLLSEANRYASVAATAGAPLNLGALRRSKQRLDAGEVDPSLPRYFVHSSSGLFSLLGDSTITSADYNTVRALVNGEIDTFMGFKFIMSERLPTLDAAAEALGYEDNFDLDDGHVVTGVAGDASGYRRNFAFAGGPMGGLLFAEGIGMQSRIAERVDKNHNTQVHTKASFGGTRMEEAKVVEILTNE